VGGWRKNADTRTASSKKTASASETVKLGQGRKSNDGQSKRAPEGCAVRTKKFWEETYSQGGGETGTIERRGQENS